MVRAHVFVSGRVQGVFFRASAAQRAGELGVCGYATNTADGRVEATFEGSRDAVEQMVQWCHKGPEWADVAAVDVTWEQPAGDTSFKIR